MIHLDHNPDRTVGLVEKVSDIHHVGAFSPALFREWVGAIEAAFELEETDIIHLFTKKAADGKHYALFASNNGEDPLVAVGGRVPKDGGEWGEVYEGLRE